jgi:hypothetical protein
MEVTSELIAELKKEIKPYNLSALIGDEGEEVVERCLEKAMVWLKAKLRTYGKEIDLTHPVIKQALLKRTLYELYSYAENEEIARDKAKDAVELLRAEVGTSIELEGFSGKGQPVAYVIPGKPDWRGFKE